MGWTQIARIVLSSEWQFSPVVSNFIYFRVRHTNLPIQAVGWLAQAEIVTDRLTQVFIPSIMIGKAANEVLELPSPAIFKNRCLALRQETKTRNNWIVIIEVSDIMPSYALEDTTPVHLLASSEKKVSTITVQPTATKVLSANPNRKGIRFYCLDKLKTVYFDTDSIVSANSALESVTPSKPICVPFIIWTGEWYAISSSGTANIEIEEYI